MKKVWNTLRSMRFGILLLILVAACSLAGSLIPQGREMSWYAENYPSFHPVLMLLQLNDVFKSWYFLVLVGLLALNLTLCSVVRGMKVLRGGKTLLEEAARRPNGAALTAEERAKLEKHLEESGCRVEEIGGARVYSKRLIGRLGSFVTHLAILLTLIFGAAGLWLPQVTDRDCMPGESVRLQDGSEFAVLSFRTSDENGRLDYASRIAVVLPDGRSRSGEISVNHPLSCGPYKVYQQTYGTAGTVTVTNLATGGGDDFLLPDPAFLTLDGVNGLWVLAVYPDYYYTPQGVLTPTGAANGEYPNPVYLLQRSEDGENTQAVAFPGDEIELGGLSFRFKAPEKYPGLRIKYTPPAVNALLFASFALMILGLVLTFFLQPVLVRVDGEGYAVCGPKPEGTRLELRALLEEKEREDQA